jgi:SAM-dependent methyltransferase
MYSECLYDWDRLVPIWDLFEDKGLNTALIDADINLVQPGVGIIGCGRGKVTHYLQQALAPGFVVGYDTSPTMAAAAQARGCRHIYLVSPDGGLPGSEKLATLIMATGVLDPLERTEIVDVLRRIASGMSACASLWIYAFGRFGINWSFAERLGATGELGIANHKLYDFYESASADSFDAAAQRHALAGRERLQAKVWLHGIGKFAAAISDAYGAAPSGAMSIVRQVTPKVARHFSSDHIVQLADTARLDTVSVRHFDAHGVSRLILRRA